MDLYLKEFKDIDCDMICINNSEYVDNTKIYRSVISIDSKPIVIKSPKLHIRKLEKNNDNLTNIHFELTSECEEFYQFILKFDKVIKKLLSNNSEKILGFPLSSVNTENLYKSTLNLPINIHHYPSFAASIESANDINVFNKSNDMLQLNSLHENNEVMILFNPTHIDFYKNRISLNIKLHTIKIYNQIPQINEYMFSDTELSDEIICSEEN